MELNDIPFKIRRCSDGEATIFSDYTLLFQTADEAILQQLNIQDSNAQLWLC